MNSNVIIRSYNLGYYNIPSDCKKDICIDIGANVGSFILSQQSNFKTIHYYEAFEDCYNLIKGRVKEFNNVLGWNEAVYNKDGETVSIMSHYTLDAGSNAIKTDSINEDWQKDWREEIGSVKTVSFNTVLERAGGHIDYLKVDCETSEYYFLIGQDLSCIDYIGIELHCQLGKTRYDELISHILKTHTTTDYYEWEHGSNKEVLFSLIKK